MFRACAVHVILRHVDAVYGAGVRACLCVRDKHVRDTHVGVFFFTCEIRGEGVLDSWIWKSSLTYPQKDAPDMPLRPLGGPLVPQPECEKYLLCVVA